MITTVAISGYRSLRDVVLPLGRLTIVTGANGTGKSSVYKSLRLLSDIADDRIIASIAREGGFRSVLWAGPEQFSRGMRDGSVPIQGTRRKHPVSLKLGFADADMTYAVELGLPVQNGTSMFNEDPEIKREVFWPGGKPTPSRIIADRRGASVRVKNNDQKPIQIASSLSTNESMIREIVGEDAPWELAVARRQLAAWRFYDHMRTDEAAPARQPQIGTRTTTLSPTGSDIAAAIQTIREIGDGGALDAAIDLAFPGARIDVVPAAGLFQLVMHQHGMLRPLGVSELSDGTLRFILLAAALLTPRPPPLLVLNEPESSLHSSVIPALASLIMNASDEAQIVVVSHNRNLVTSLLDADASLVELSKNTGETFVEGSERPAWDWPAR